MPFGIRVLPSRARVIEFVPRSRGSIVAESLVNEPCGTCGKPIGMDTEFHEVNKRLHHADCLSRREPAQGAE